MTWRYEQLWTQVRDQVQQTSQATLESGRNAWARWWATLQPPASEPPASSAPAPKLTLALGGGGGRGAAHLGVLRVLEELQVPIDAIAGTSIGGAIGIMYAAGHTTDQIAHLFQNFTLWRIFATDPTGTGFIGLRKGATLLRELLGERTFADLRIPCAVVATDLISGREVVISEGPLVEAILATTAIPAVFPAVVRDAQLLVDGGVLNSLPVDVAERLCDGQPRVIAVQLRDPPFGIDPVPAAAGLRLGMAPRQLEIASRVLGLMIDQVTELRLAQHPPALCLYPDVGRISILDFSRSKEGIDAGEHAARAADAELLALRAWRLSSEQTQATMLPARIGAKLG